MDRAGKAHHKSPIQDIAQEINALRDAADRLEHGAPQVRRTSYKSVTHTSPGRDGETEETHESFGKIGFSRCQGSRSLFGSHLEKHGTFISMTVRRARRIHGLSHDWIHSDSRLPIIEVYLSAAQFAEAITSMNMGEGVPCTIASVEGVDYEGVPGEVHAENVRIRDGFKDKISGVVNNLAAAHKEMDAVVESKSTISKGRAREIVGILGKALQEMRSNAPYIVESFQESAEKVVTHAKAEVEAFTALALRNAGMEHMRLQAPGAEEKRLEEGSGLP
jgi:hypothetical protein